ncbi:outer membrane beta-barrel protein [Helicobacter saguini]|uniref:Outer membrane beta-barrel protein n=1 Tax=Helicobacter saguini TaxID=1548018 RepID=A0A347VR08_9HELI|nr:outer membrane beta-barrel protein [Helicobacter saguini]MWV63084.1 outer membrane beta-barrel protein [Helicobacter saguini]MWV66246.1 outer membrane beta-barrel protein [Helicobacter saguini]MWV68599.1 outer membrane beta-barrel protein [Helicobacter saguini]MWV71850.1 outer membrane beta-barrel protein [Helicobacter saguini]TLD95869.1 outer membrane beta-barrel protein [Helicobacter saguini]
MKKLLINGTLALALSASLVQVAWARAFVGIDAGYDSAFPKLDNGLAKESYQNFTKYSIDGWNVGLNVGGEWFFGGSGYVGLRTFLQLGYGQGYFHGVTLNIIDVNLNLDLLANFYNSGSFSVGAFLGVGAGINTAARDLAGQSIMLGLNIPIYGRAGFTFGLGEHSRVDITASLPILSYNMIGFAGGGMSAEDLADMFRYGIVGAYNPIRFNVGYKFIF